MTAPELAIVDIAARIGAALLCGAVIGLNRDLHRKPAGLRTFGLIALGAATLTIGIGHYADAAAVSRVVQGMVTGIGFLGAGMILRPANSNEVHGLTTAAAVWLTTALAILCGLDQAALALGVLALALGVLLIGGPVERFCERRFGSAAPAGSSADSAGDESG